MKRTFTLVCASMVMLLATAQPIRVLSNQKVADGWNPKFSQDATELLYVENEADEVPESVEQGSIYVANEDLQIVLYHNGERKILAPHGTDVNYVWISLSPDRTKILFNTLHGTGVCDLQGKEIVNLGGLDAPVWCGNDKVVGMFDTHDGDFFTSSCIAIRSLDGSIDQQLTDPKEFGMYPAVSAQTGMIAYSTLNGEVRLMKTDMHEANAQLKVRKVTHAICPLRAPKAPYTSPSQVKIYINPGHGGHDSDDRPMYIYPFPRNDPNSFWESNSNLDKGLKLNEWLQREGFQTKMSRTQNRTEDDRALSAIVAEANAYGADFMLSIHSNAGGPSNYVLELYSGQDERDTRTYRNPAPRQAESRAISTIIAKWLTSNKVTTWSPASRVNGWVVGDKTFGYEIMGGWGDGYGVLRKLAVPGVISEGCMHDYIPETYRLMNMDYKWREAFYFMAAFCEYFLDYTLPYGAIGGQVRDWYNKMEFPAITAIKGSRDELLPIDRAKVELLQNGTVIKTYTTDTLYNGVFFFWDLKPGKYTLRTEPDHYYPMEKEIEVKAGDIAYQDLLVDKKRETRPEVISYSPNVAITDSVKVSEKIVLNFNWDMLEDPTRAAFSISPAVEGEVTFENSFRTLVFTPARRFEKSTEYTVTLAKSACHPDSRYPNTLAEDFVMKFRTKNRSDLDIVLCYPQTNATNVPLNPSFILICDEKLNSSSARNAMTLKDAEGKSLNINTRSYRFNTLTNYGNVSFEAVDALEPDKDYKLVIGSDMADASGVFLNRVVEIPFHTQLLEESVLPVIDKCETQMFNADTIESRGIKSASAMRNSSKKYADSYSNGLMYNFSDADGFALYRYSKAADVVGNSVSEFACYVFSDFSGNELDAQWSAEGDIHYTKMTMLDYAGWRYVRSDLSSLPEGVDFQFMGFRLSRKESVLSEQGSIYVDNLCFARKEPTAVDDVKTESIVISPNPSNTLIHVLGTQGKTVLTLYGLDGKQIKSAEGSLLNVDNVYSGMYLLRITTDKDNTVKPVIITH